MEQLTIEYPDSFELAIKITKSEFERELLLMAALKMFELGKISSGKAAELAGMSRIEFFEACGQYRVSIFNYLPEEVERELENDLETLQELKRDQ